jgi:hypothetical protein
MITALASPETSRRPPASDAVNDHGAIGARAGAARRARTRHGAPRGDGPRVTLGARNDEDPA